MKKELENKSTIKFNGKRINLSNNLFSSLNNSVCCYIRKDWDISKSKEMLLRYHVVVKDENDDMTYLFKCKDKSNSFWSSLLSKENSPVLFEVNHIKNNNDLLEEENFIKMQKGCCSSEIRCNILSDFDNSNSSHDLLGSIKLSSCLCSAFEFSIKTKQNIIKVKGEYYQKGLFCNSLEKVFFDIIEDDQVSGKIIRSPSNLIDELKNNNGGIDIVFPEDITTHEKLLLILNSIYIEYLFFFNEPNTYKQKSGSFIQMKEL